MMNSKDYAKYKLALKREGERAVAPKELVCTMTVCIDQVEQMSKHPVR
jgi:hypothetical protein